MLIVSDVDGTLIDEQGRLPCTAHELRARIDALAAARGAPVRVALASSRTMRELTVLQRALGLYGPCIAEDGALLGIDVHEAQEMHESTPGTPLSGTASPNQPDTIANASKSIGATDDVSSDGRFAFTTEGRRRLVVEQFAADASALEALMHDVPAFHRADVRQLGTPEWRALGFRTPASVRRALVARRNSILLDPQVLDGDALKTLHDKAADHTLQLRRGGRWLTLTAARGKGAALRALRHGFRLDGVSPLLVAIGNEENDVSLLEEADLRFVIRNPHRGPLESLASLPGAVIVSPEGPGGWIDMLDHLHQFGA